MTEGTPRWAFKIMCGILGAAIMVGGGLMISIGKQANTTAVEMGTNSKEHAAIIKILDRHEQKLDMLIIEKYGTPLTFKEEK